MLTFILYSWPGLPLLGNSLLARLGLCLSKRRVPRRSGRQVPHCAGCCAREAKCNVLAEGGCNLAVGETVHLPLLGDFKVGVIKVWSLSY